MAERTEKLWNVLQPKEEEEELVIDGIPERQGTSCRGKSLGFRQTYLAFGRLQKRLENRGLSLPVGEFLAQRRREDGSGENVTAKEKVVERKNTVARRLDLKGDKTLEARSEGPVTGQIKNDAISKAAEDSGETSTERVNLQGSTAEAAEILNKEGEKLQVSDRKEKEGQGDERSAENCVNVNSKSVGKGIIVNGKSW